MLPDVSVLVYVSDFILDMFTFSLFLSCLHWYHGVMIGVMMGISPVIDGFFIWSEFTG